ncbi:uncharacterized protein L969DRAFT_43950 [Mixia osmundae IAM 14324]|uniref:Rieske domain-containing protein n=1 Tax=Mixia osmundae (strain CBS 9802 / IAM 14324 / JCM 22182 / KY 12970) TaxID=764103 RepID=G7DT79_MIXOS|nr:uncharacterized protein L969DRAFT_43950 [Mixia osmundae IAM 14324]KEI42936.1 hypothetical protein L969DRAFT_43950 [Mixia osmundae IAM 14324]GAA93726.1 hypothetical protein E5Q_00372 [Mixia osmundae IAM 14324]
MKAYEWPTSTKDKERKVLLVNVNGKVSAIAPKCTHYGAPLEKGVLSEGGRIVCPWHGACFKSASGDIEDAPGLDSLESFKAEVEGDKIFVTADNAAIDRNNRKPTFKATGSKSSCSKGTVIVGGGSGGAFCAEGLREYGYQDPVTLITMDNYMPIDRTKLSKALIDDPSKVALRDQAFYDSINVNVKLGTKAVSLDPRQKSLKLDNGSEISYDKLVLATGGAAKRLPLDGVNLKNIYTLRDITDTKAINASLGNDENIKKNLIIVGSSFIGMEAAVATAKRAHVTVVGQEKTPFEKILGPEVGAGIQHYHEKQGVKFALDNGLSHFEPSENDKEAVGSVVLQSGQKLPADLVILGVGVGPRTELLKPYVEINKDGSVSTDEFLQVKGLDDIYAIGDIANYFDVKLGSNHRIEHWNTAGNHGRAVAETLSGNKQAYSKQAIFWSAQGTQLRYVGTSEASQWQDVLVKGDPGELKFVAYYFKDDAVVAICTMQNDPMVSYASELLRLGKFPSAKEIKAGKDPLEIKIKL